MILWCSYLVDYIEPEGSVRDTYFETHSPDDTPLPTFGRWYNVCMLHNLHPFFSDKKLPITEEGMQYLWLSVRDVIDSMDKKYGDDWWKEKEIPEEEKKAADEFKHYLDERIATIPDDIRQKYKLSKEHKQIASEVPYFNEEFGSLMVVARLDWVNVQNVTSAYSFNNSKIGVPDVSVKKVTEAKVCSMDEYNNKKRSSFTLGSLLKKSNGWYGRREPASQNSLSRHVLRDREMSTRQPSFPKKIDVSWGLDKPVGFGEFEYRCTHVKMRNRWMPLPNVKEWFDWCRENNVNPKERGKTYICGDISEESSLLKYEKDEIAFAKRLWAHRTPPVVNEYSGMTLKRWQEKTKKMLFPDIMPTINRQLNDLASALQHNLPVLRKRSDAIISRTSMVADALLEDGEDYSKNRPQIDFKDFISRRGRNTSETYRKPVTERRWTVPEDDT